MNTFSHRTRTLHLIVDDGVLSSTRAQAGKPEIEGLLELAADEASTLEPGDKIHIVRTTSPDQSGSPTTNLDGAVQEIRGISETQLPTRLEKSLEHTLQVIKSMGGDGDHQVLLLSSFRNGTFAHEKTIDLEWPDEVSLGYSKPKSNLVNNTRIKFINIESEGEHAGDSTQIQQQNISIYLEREGEGLPTHEEKVEIKTGTTIFTRSVHWKAGQSQHNVQFKLPLTSLKSTGVSVNIDSTDALKADDTAHRIAAPRQIPNTLFISRNSITQGPRSLPADHWIKLALYPTTEPKDHSTTVDPSTLQLSDMSGIDLVVLTRPDLIDSTTMDVLKKHIQSGGVMIITPPGEAGTTPWGRNIFSTLGIPWETTSIVQEIEPPLGISQTKSTTKNLPLVQNELTRLLAPIHVNKTCVVTGAREGEAIIQLENGAPAILASSPPGTGEGQVILFSFNPTPGWSNIPTQPLMVPLIQELVHGSLSRVRSGPELYTGQHLEIKNPTPGTTLNLEDRQHLLVDTKTSRTSNMVEQPGVWKLRRAGKSGFQLVAVNTDPLTTVTTPTPTSTIPKRLGHKWKEWSPGEDEHVAEHGSLQEILLLLLLLLVALDAVLANWFTPRGTAMAGVRAP